MQTYGSLFQRELDMLIKKRIEDLRDRLESVDANTDFLRGQIFALRDLGDLMEEAAEKSEQANF